MLLANDVPLYAVLAKGDSRKDWLDTSMPVVSNFGEGGTLAGLAALSAWLGGPRMRRTSTTALQGLAVTGVYAAGLKYAAWANRPSQDDQSHRFLAYDQSSLGMPSGHSFSSFCVAEVYGAEYGRAWTYPLAALVAYSRIYNQAHWPSDVLVGSVLGVAAGRLAVRQAKEQGPAQWRWGLRPGLDGPVAVAETSF